MLRPLILPLVVFFVSCSSRPGQNPTRDTVQLSNLAQQDTTTPKDSTDVKNSSGDTLIVDQLCAVFYIADSSTQAEKRKKMVGTDTTYGGVDGTDDDNAYYMGRAAEFLDKHKVKILSVDDKKYIL